MPNPSTATRASTLLLPALALGACHPDLTPSWAFDPIWLESADQTADGPVHGFQTWQVYGPKWAKKQKDRFYVCAVVTELTGETLDTCDAPGCVTGFVVTGEILETDCVDATLAEAPLFTSLAGLALAGPYAAEDAPWPGRTTVTYADYGDGWDQHGYAYPEAFDQGGAADPAWTGEDPFLFTPTAAFPAP